METLLLLLGCSLISIHIPHKSKKYNLSWHSRLLIIASFFWFIIKLCEGVWYIITKIF